MGILNIFYNIRLSHLTTCLLLSFLLISNTQAQQEKKKFVLKIVEVPDSIRARMAYVDLGRDTLRDYFDSLHMAVYVHNLIYYQDYRYSDGIYSWKGMGPHFPRRLLIYHKSKTYIFKSIGAYEPLNVMQEYLKAANELNISEDIAIQYLEVVSKYLKNEQGLTYGAEIKKAK